MSKKVLVTGGAGYIGSHTVVELFNSGYEAIILDDFRNSDISVIEGLTKILGRKPQLVQCDVCDTEQLEKTVSSFGISAIIHFAAYKAVGESVEKPLDYYSNNISGLLSVLDIIKKNPEITFVFSYSCTVYGEPEGIKEVSEQTAKSIPTSPYGYTKWLGEQIMEDLSVPENHLRMMSLRYFNPIGAHESSLIGELPIGNPNNLLPFITQTAAEIHKEVTIFGDDYPTKDGTCIRDFIHVVDLAKAHVKAVDYLFSKESGSYEVVNIGTGKGTSVLELIHTFENENSIKLNYSFGPRRPGDVIEIYANVDYALRLLGWKSDRDIKDAVKDAWSWEKSIRNIE